MNIQNKILLKQTLLLVLISVLFYSLGSIGSYVETYGGPEPLGFYLIFYVYLFFILLIFTPISIIYFLRIRKNTDLKWLNIAFKIFCWIFISTLLLVFILGIYESFYFIMDLAGFYGYKLSLLNRFWAIIHTFQSIDMAVIVNLLCYTPALILAGLLYWAVRINKKISS